MRVGDISSIPLFFGHCNKFVLFLIVRIYKSIEPLISWVQSEVLRPLDEILAGDFSEFSRFCQEVASISLG